MEYNIQELNSKIIDLEKKRRNLIKRKSILEEKYHDMRNEFVKQKMVLDKEISLVNSEIKEMRNSFKLRGIQKRLGKTRNKRQLTSSQKQLVIDLKGGKCSKCGATKDLIVGHEIPLSQNGQDKWENYAIYCKECELKNNRIN